ncbi:hypothetical protein AGMMS50256_04990 [Betaproteobacteria bacterium]|nr:hypothetical protein AGMMS50256_04990 [Betaproteobacteria bacterium]
MRRENDIEAGQAGKIEQRVGDGHILILEKKQVGKYISLEKAVKRGYPPHPAFGHLLPSREKGEYSPSPACGRGCPEGAGEGQNSEIYNQSASF